MRRKQAELRNYNPSWREQVGAFASRALGGIMGGDETKFTAGQGRKIADVLDTALGPATYGNDAYRSAKRGDYLGAAGNAAMGALSLPFIPAVSKTKTLFGKSPYAPADGMPKTFTLPSGETKEAMPIPAIQDAAASYMKSRGMPHMVPDGFEKIQPERAGRIANAYDVAKDMPTDPETLAAYERLVEETAGQYRALEDAGINFKFMGKDDAGNVIDPYAASPAMGYDDLANRNTLEIFPTDDGFGTLDEASAAHPLLRDSGFKFGDAPATNNDLFRAVHDAYGHFGPGNAYFRAPGEERAFQWHKNMFSPEAQRALTAETRGQNSWLNYGPHAEHNRTAKGADTIFADQKTTLLPQWATDEAATPVRDAGAFSIAAPRAVLPSPVNLIEEE